MPRTYASTVVDADPEVVWRYIRDFNRTPDYLDTVTASEIADDRSADQVGCERVLVLRDGHVVRETLLGIDDEHRRLRYRLTESPFAFSNYCSTMEVSSVTASGGAFVAWWSDYDCDAADAEAVEELLARDLYAPGLARLKALLERPAA